MQPEFYPKISEKKIETIVKPKVQTRLKITPPHDEYEQEADKVADKVSLMPEKVSDNPPMLPKKEDEEEKIQMKLNADESLKMQPESKEQEDKIQMKTGNLVNGHTPMVSSELTTKLESTKGQGNPLPENTGMEMSQKIGGDFSNVFIHTDSNAIQMNKELGAQAFTHGNDIYFNSGKYSPESTSGKHLLAHELTHTIQQSDNKLVSKKPGNNLIQLQPEVKPAIKDEKIKYDLPKYYVKKVNLDWWDKLGLSEINPLADYNPISTPNAYANRVYEFQRLVIDNNIDKIILNQKIIADGILGFRTFLIMFILANKYNTNDENKETLTKAGFDNKIFEQIINAKGPALVHSVRASQVYLTKPKKIFDWVIKTNIESITNAFGLGSLYTQDIDKGLDLLFLKEVHKGNSLSKEDKIAILNKLFKDIEIPGKAMFFEAERDFVHKIDMQLLMPKMTPKFSVCVWFLIAGPDLYSKSLETLNIDVPENKKAQKAEDAILSPGVDDKKTTAMGYYFFLPVVKQDLINKNVSQYLIDKEIKENADTEAAVKVISDFSEKVKLRLKGTPDIDDYQILLELLAQPGGIPISNEQKISGLLKKAELELGLVVKIGKDSEPFMLSYLQILESRKKAGKNKDNPLDFGLFKPGKGSILHVDAKGFTAKTQKDQIKVARAVNKLTYDTGAGEEKTGPVWSDWKYYEAEYYNHFDPVKIRISELNPNTTFWVQRYRQLFGTEVWKLQEFWVLGSSLPEISDKLWDYAKTQNIVAWIDFVISMIAAASVIAGPLLAVESGVASGAISLVGSQFAIQLTKEIIKSAFWFVASEILAQKILDFDLKINTDKKYTDEDRTLWNIFKYGLLVLGGTLLIRQAWKGLRGSGSAAMRASLLEIEEEMVKATVKTGETELKLGAGYAKLEASAAVKSSKLFQTVSTKASKFLFGEKNIPTRVEAQKLLDEVWKKIGRKGKPTITVRELPNKKTSGYFNALVGEFGEIVINAKAVTKGELADTVFHEAMHAHLRELFPFLSEKSLSWQRTMFRHLDEIISYGYGSMWGKVKHSPKIAEKLYGLLEFSLSNWLAYCSANNIKEAIPGMVRDVMLLIGYIYLIIKIAESTSDTQDTDETKEEGK